MRDEKRDREIKMEIKILNQFGGGRVKNIIQKSL